jgi:serine/threonine-protein kinase
MTPGRIRPPDPDDPRKPAGPEELEPESPTVAVPRSPMPPGDRSGSSGPSDRSLSTSTPSLDGGLFAPGTLILNRYRTVGLLGRGGMGEVYRADDLTLGQSVALKFLPEELTDQEDRRQRFHQEVRIARTVAHPNVCRVYDIGEAEGRVFLSMEFVDGEDLGLLLRRIGRMPVEKGIDIARQLCAGLAGLHDQGILHRDLKPTNVMIDGRGRVRITDFGLAGIGAEIDGAEIRAGTPAYMAPEQLTGEGIDARSDLYSLGLVLYEMFTGKRAFNAKSVPELARLMREEVPESPSTILPDMDPAVERVISRCLERDPDSRPPSALAVAAALPGGDPVAAALAAGEIPSLEMVAATGGKGGIRPAVGWACVLAGVLGIVVAASVNVRSSLHHFDPLTKPPTVLRDRARGILESVGLQEPPEDTAHGFLTDRRLLAYISEENDDPERWETLRDAWPAGVRYWYRQSPTQFDPAAMDETVSLEDPPSTISGMASVLLDTTGRLLYLSVVPPQHDSTAAPAAEPTWDALFAAAGLDVARFTPVEPEWLPPHFADQRVAWTGPDPEYPDREIRVEAAAYRGRPVHYEVQGPWTRAERMASEDDEIRDEVIEAILVIFIVSMLVGAVYMAIRNVRLGRGDRHGARRLSVFIFLLYMITWALSANHAANTQTEINMIFHVAAGGLLAGALLGSFYLALEPYVRKTWPDRIVSWTRLLMGRFRDPLVGRDILFGGVAFLGFVLLQNVAPILCGILEAPPHRPESMHWNVLLGPTQGIADLLGSFSTSIFNSMFFVLFLLFLRLIGRSQRVANILFVVIVGALMWVLAPDEAKWVGATAGLLVGVLWLVVLIRFGLLPFLVMFFCNQIAGGYPLTFDSSVWYSGASIFGMGVIVALLLYGLRIAGAKGAHRGDRLPGH